MFAARALAFTAITLISSSVANDQKCIPISLRVTAEFFEKSYESASKHNKVITASSSFRKDYNKLAVAAEVSASFGAFSGSAKASYEGITETIEQMSSSRHEESSKEENYKPGFLQIERKITTEFIIDGKVAKSVERELVDSVPIENSESPQQLKQRADRYIIENFGYLANEKGAELRGNVYRAEACVPYQIQTEECNTEKGDYIGCYVDDKNRDLKQGPKQYGYNQKTCNAACQDYSYYALQNNGWCVCGNFYSTRPHYSKRPDGECGGSHGLGKGWRNSLYATCSNSKVWKAIPQSNSIPENPEPKQQDGLKCYECNPIDLSISPYSNMNKLDCLTNENDYGELKNCDDLHSACAKGTIDVNGIEFTIRKCHPYGVGKVGTCEKVTHLDQDINLCFCGTNYCNGSNQQHLTIHLLAAIISLIIMFLA